MAKEQFQFNKRLQKIEGLKNEAKSVRGEDYRYIFRDNRVYETFTNIADELIGNYKIAVNFPTRVVSDNSEGEPRLIYERSNILITWDGELSSKDSSDQVKKGVICEVVRETNGGKIEGLQFNRSKEIIPADAKMIDQALSAAIEHPVTLQEWNLPQESS
jgi:hypothetical protein